MRNSLIDYTKAIGIILVVIGHSACPIAIKNFIYSFHMPLFFIISGYLIPPTCFKNKVCFFKRKFKGLYIPFVIWSIVFLLLHNTFIHIGILNDVYGNHNGDVSILYSYEDYVNHVKDIVFKMTGYEWFLLGAYWFVRALYVGLLLFCLGGSFLNLILKTRIKAVLMLMLFSYGMVYYIAFNDNLAISKAWYRELFALFFICIGFLLRNYFYGIPKNKLIVVLCLFVLIPVSVLNINMSTLSPTLLDLLLLPLTGTCGFVLIYNIAQLIDNTQFNRIKGTLSFIGKYSFLIFTFHILFFKPVSYLKVCLFDLPKEMIGCHPVIWIENGSFWMVYSVVSLILSISFVKVYNAVEALLFRYLRK